MVPEGLVAAEERVQAFPNEERERAIVVGALARGEEGEHRTLLAAGEVNPVVVHEGIAERIAVERPNRGQEGQRDDDGPEPRCSDAGGGQGGWRPITGEVGGRSRPRSEGPHATPSARRWARAVRPPEWCDQAASIRIGGLGGPAHATPCTRPGSSVPPVSAGGNVAAWPGRPAAGGGGPAGGGGGVG